jgi:hypothetical protein
LQIGFTTSTNFLGIFLHLYLIVLSYFLLRVFLIQKIAAAGSHLSASLSATSPPVSTLFPRGCYAPAPAPHHKGVGRHRLSAVRTAPPPHCRSASRPRMSERHRLCCPSAPHRRVAPHSSTGKAVTPLLPPLHRTTASYSEVGCRPSPPSPCLCRSSPRGVTPSSELRSPPPSRPPPQ